MVGFLKTGSDANSALQHEEEKIASSNTFDFYIKKGGPSAIITFLDGDLDDNGMLKLVQFSQHSIQVNGKWTSEICINYDQPCPMCQAGNKAALCHAFTVIDHTPYTMKDGTEKAFTVKKFIAKRTTVKLLQKYATKHGGLAGCTFEISRVGDNSPSVGDTLDFEAKNDLESICKKFEVEGPLDYAEVLIPSTREELAQMGMVMDNSMGGGLAPSYEGGGDPKPQQEAQEPQKTKSFDPMADL